MLLPADSDARLVLGMVKAAFAPAGRFDELQQALLEGIAPSLYGIDLGDVAVATPEQVGAAPADERLHAVHLTIVLEFVEHPLDDDRVESPVEHYARGFPFPGERHGIYELDARHDWVHVLAGYETTPEGELDVFAHKDDPLDAVREQFGVVPILPGI